MLNAVEIEVRVFVLVPLVPGVAVRIVDYGEDRQEETKVLREYECGTMGKTWGRDGKDARF